MNEDAFREVSKDAFFAAIGPLNVHPQIQSRWPYTTLFKEPSGRVRGKVVDFLPPGEALAKSRFWLPK